MYTTIMMAALTVGSANPGWGRGCHGYHGGVGIVNACYGSCLGCYGYGSNGSACHGCYGNFGWGCQGCYGGWGPGYAGGGYATLVCTGCYGCYGGWACYGTPVLRNQGTTTTPDVVTAPTTPIPDPPSSKKAIPTPPNPELVPSKKPVVNPTPTPPEEARIRSKVIIDVPEGAKLFVDGQLMRAGSTRRIFQTPELLRGSTYFYDIRIEVESEGRVLVDQQRILVRPGQEITAAYRGPGAPDGVVTVRAGGE